MTAPVCVTCGRQAGDEAPLTWTAQETDRGRVWVCDRCTREHIRGIEGRLDPQWW